MQNIELFLHKTNGFILVQTGKYGLLQSHPKVSRAHVGMPEFSLSPFLFPVLDFWEFLDKSR
jgi:hypothetical protein